MVDKGDIFTKELKKVLFYKKEIGETLESSNRDDVFLEYQRTIKLIKRFRGKIARGHRQTYQSRQTAHRGKRIQ